MIALALAAALGAPLDSQLVLERYAARLLALEPPKAMIFTYSVSQAGPRNIEQTHRIYRSGDLVRDETLTSEGQPVRPKVTRIAHYRDRYSLDTIAPRTTQYALLFMRAVRSGNSYDYVYRAEPLGVTGAFVVEGVTIDGRSYLPSSVRFHSSNGGVSGSGTIDFGRAGKHWMATAASVEASVEGKPARERITFSGYVFPGSLPKSTFQAPKPLPTPALPTF
ncbi:MAG TPA: hypothetical protein VFA29_00360 [Candidatus Baltobacteraceae bacterium]|nr:hypothetical protein [Candidatus Baltobacteraceae bacterium]